MTAFLLLSALLLSALLLSALVLASLLTPAAASAQTVDPYLALPRTTGGPTSAQLLLYRLGNGSGSKVDQLRREPTRLEIRRLEGNLFREIGRANDQPAGLGEIFLEPILLPDGSARSALFVETTTGYTVYFDQLGKANKLGNIVTLIGRPFGPLAAADNNFALLTRRRSGGRTVGAYLYHATTGKGLYMEGLQDLEIDPKISSTVELPKLTGKVTAASITDSERTTSYVLIDNADGRVGFLELNESRPEQLRYRPTDLLLGPLFQADVLNPSPRRFSALSLQDRDDTTIGIFLVDAATGQVAILDGLGLAVPRVSIPPSNIYSLLPSGSGMGEAPRVIELAAHQVSAQTVGLWLFDSLTSSVFYISEPADPIRLNIQRVTLDR